VSESNGGVKSLGWGSRCNGALAALFRFRHRIRHRVRHRASVGALVILLVASGCFTLQPVSWERAEPGATLDVRFASPAHLAVRAADPTAYPVRLVRGRLLRASAEGDSLWVRPDSVVGQRDIRSTPGGAEMAQDLQGPWADRLLILPAPGEVQYLERRFSRRRTLVAIGATALTWVLYVVYDMAVNGPFKES
jgi:hypothetical protein